MREIKVKVFDKFEKKFYYPECFSIQPRSFDRKVQGQSVSIGNQTFDEFSLYTGRKDKNGKEGYHRDVAVSEDSKRGSSYWLIEWDEIEAHYYLKSLAGYDPLPLRKLKEMVIYTNTYENPELLK